MPEGDRTFFRCESRSSDCHERAQELAGRVRAAGNIADVFTVWDPGGSFPLGFDVLVREIVVPEIIVGPPADAGSVARSGTGAVAASPVVASRGQAAASVLGVPASRGSLAALLASVGSGDLGAFQISSRDLGALHWSGGWLGVPGGIGGTIVAGPNTFAGSYSCGCGPAGGAVTGRTDNGLGIDLSSSPPAWLIWLAVGLGLYAATRK